MDSTLTQLGIGGILAVLVLQQVFGFLKGRNGGAFTKDDIARIRKAVDQTYDLHKWHDQADTDGVKVWYVRRSLEEAVSKLAESIALQIDVSGEMLRELKDTRGDVRNIGAKLDARAEKNR